jgi:hypothetical protein
VAKKVASVLPVAPSMLPVSYQPSGQLSTSHTLTATRHQPYDTRMGSYPFYLDLPDRDIRDVLWLLASRWEEFRPDDTRTLRSLVGEHSTADECRERLCVGLEPGPDDPLPGEIAAQAAKLRQGWVDEHRVVAEDFDEATGIRVFCETDRQGLAESPLS